MCRRHFQLLAALWVVAVAMVVAHVRCPTECACRLTALRPTADCAGAHLRSLPAGLPADTAHLRLGFNNISSISNRSLAGVLNIVRLWINNNAIEIIEPGAFNYLSALSWLNLEDNKISHIHPDSFGNLQHLFKLVLSGNPIILPSAQSFLRTESLQILDMENCRLDEIPSHSFHNMRSLMTLRLGNNSIRSIELNIPSLFHLDLHKNSLGPSTNRVHLITPKLQRLDLSSCIFGDMSHSFLSSFPKLEHFDISDNIIQSFDADTFQDLTDLKKINLTNNLIGSLPAQIFSENSKLEMIDLSNNPITVSRNSYINNCSARIITLNKCRLRELLPHTLSGFPNATELHLSNNKLHSLSKLVFRDMPSLTSIYLDGNKLNQFDADAFADLTALTFLDLSRNPLNQDTWSGAGVEELSETEAPPLRSPSLRALRMADCALEALSARALSGLPELRSLSLEGNSLRALDPAVLRAAPLLQVLRLQGNPWECDCPLRALWFWCIAQDAADAGDAARADNEGETAARDAGGSTSLSPVRCPDAEETGCGRPSNRRFTTLAVLTCRANSEEELDLEGDVEWVGAGGGALSPRAPPDRLASAPALALAPSPAPSNARMSRLS